MNLFRFDFINFLRKWVLKSQRTFADPDLTYPGLHDLGVHKNPKLRVMIHIESSLS
jgi:hypothetical protein